MLQLKINVVNAGLTTPRNVGTSAKAWKTCTINIARKGAAPKSHTRVAVADSTPLCEWKRYATFWTHVLFANTSAESVECGREECIGTCTTADCSHSGGNNKETKTTAICIRTGPHYCRI